MNLILLDKDDFLTDNRVKLCGRRYLHARNVLNADVGKKLQVGLLGGKMGTGTVVSFSETAFEMEVNFEQPPPPSPPITVILAMPRPKVFNRVLQGLAAMGIKRIILLNTWRVDKSYWQSPVLEPKNLHEQLVLGLEQARDTIIPEVKIEIRFRPFVEDRLPGIAKDTYAMIAHPGTDLPCPVDIKKPVTLAIGPEGGFTTYEVDKMVTAGLIPIHLGVRSLRVEHAVPALLGRLLPF